MNAIANIDRQGPIARVQNPLPAYDARTLTRDGAQANILLDGQVYVLRITRAGKLILTK